MYCRLVRVFLIRIDFDEPHCKSNLGWFHHRVPLSPQRCGMFEYFIQAHKALFGPQPGPLPRHKRKGEGFRGRKIIRIWLFAF